MDANKLWELYQKLGSVHVVGAAVGVTGDTVWRRLKKAGFKLKEGKWSAEELGRLRRYYEDTPASEFSLDAAAQLVGRDRIAVALKASRLGLSKMGRPKNAKVVEAMKAARAGQWSRKPHPRGMLGKKHNDDVRMKVAKLSRERWERWRADGTGLESEHHKQRMSDEMSRRQRENERMRRGYSRGKAGRRKDLGNMHFRSSWEANYARYLKMLATNGKILKWEFETETFWFEAVKRGVRSYLPDFKVWPADGGAPYYVEVKGWMDAKSKTKINRMAKYHPGVKLIVVGEREYKALDSAYRDVIPYWEGKGVKEVTAEQYAAANPPAPEWLSEAAQDAADG